MADSSSRFCSSYYATYKVRSSSGRPPYAVSILGVELLGVCNCQAFEYWKGEIFDRTCKHIEYAKANACFWNSHRIGRRRNPPKLYPESISGHNLIPDSECPRCGAPLVRVEIEA
jgi:hypothetical protein